MKNPVVDALIEIPLGSKNKYELDKQTGRIRCPMGNQSLVFSQSQSMCVPQFVYQLFQIPFRHLYFLLRKQMEPQAF